MKKDIYSLKNPELVETFFKNSPYPIAIFDKEGNFKYINKSFEDYLGIKAKDILDKKYESILDKEQVKVAKKALRNVLGKGKVETIQIKVETQKKEILYSRIHLIPFSSGGEIAGFISIGRNITRRLIAEEAFLKAERKYKELIDNSPVGIYRTTPDGKVLFANKKLIEILGFSSFEELSKLDLEKNGYHPDSPRSVFKNLIELKTELKNYEAKWLKKDQSVIYIRENAKAIKDENGKTIYYEGTVEDITKEKEAEEKLYQRTRELQAIFSAIPDLFFKINKDGVIIDYMAGEKKDLYLPPSEFLGKNLKNLFPVQISEKAIKAINEALTKNKMEIIEYELQIDKEEKHFETRIIPFLKDQAIGIVRNITSKKLWEKALKESEARFRTITENAITGVYIIQNEKFIYVNPAFCQIFGYNLEELIGKLGPLDLTYKDDIEIAKKNIQVRVSGETPTEKAEFRGIKKDGRIIYIETYSSSIDLLGKKAIMGILLDITQRKEAENSLNEYASKLKKLLDGIVLTIAKIVEVKDPYTAGHQQRVADLAVKIGEEMGLEKNKLDSIQVASMIHDIGKIHIPAEILTKPGELSPLEREMIQNHPLFGYEILKNIEFPWPIAQIVLQHHEKIDGSGYPLRLKGDQIMLEAKIVAVADVVEAMSTHRPYRAGHGLAKALDEIISHCGLWYDEKVVHICLNIFKEKDFEFKHTV